MVAPARAHLALVAGIASAIACAAMLTGCYLWTADVCAPQPFAQARLAVARPSAVPLRAPAAGSCYPLVVFDNARYGDTRGGAAAWNLTDDDLTAVGSATGASAVTPRLTDATTFAVAGVDPQEAIAVHEWDGRILIFVNEAASFPAGLCRFLVDRSRELGCAAAP
jgi:hypothetical protein